MLFDPGCTNCGCPAASGRWRVYVVGCGAAPQASGFVASPASGFAGCTCDLYADAGRTVLVATGTTDAVGRADVSPPAPGTYYARITPPAGRRHQPYDPPAAVVVGAGNTDRGYVLATDAGYFCLCGSCTPGYFPGAASWALTTTWGSTTLSLVGGVPTGYLTFDWPGGGGCAAGPVTLRFEVQPGNCGLYVSCRRGFTDYGAGNVNACPTGSYTDWFTAGFAAASAITCPPGLFVAGGAADKSIYDFSHSAPEYQTLINLFGGTTYTYSYTLTES